MMLNEVANHKSGNLSYNMGVLQLFEVWIEDICEFHEVHVAQVKVKYHTLSKSTFASVGSVYLTRVE